MKNIIFWSVGFANWIVGPERCSKFAPKLVGENAVTTLLAPGYELPPGSFFFFHAPSQLLKLLCTYSKLLKIIMPSYYLTLGTTGIRP